jgi:hypothetical protein
MSNARIDGCIIESYDIPVLNIRPAPYKNGILIRELSKRDNRNDILNQIVAALQIHNQADNLFGVYFIDENDGNEDHLSVLLLLRNTKKFFKAICERKTEDLHFIRINGFLKEVLSLDNSNYDLMFMSNDPKFHHKLLKFNNEHNLSLNQAWNIFDKVVTENPKEIKAVIATKKDIFLLCTTDSGCTDCLRALILKFGTDFNLQEINEILVFVKKPNSNSHTYKSNEEITISISNSN